MTDSREHPAMRVFRLALAAVLASGCAPMHAHVRSEMLAARAWYGQEPSPSADESAVIEFANEQVGKRYCWGGAGPSCFDCSGLVKRAWGVVGIRLPHSSEAIASLLEEIPIDAVRAGDVLWWPGHVAIYAGHGVTIEALDARDGVVRRTAQDPRRAFRPQGY